MKAGKGFCTWHSCLSVAVVGALALAVSVQGSPRAGERGKTDGKSGASRLVTGPSAHINDAIAVGPGASVTLQPVAPKTQPPSAYPGSITGQTLTLTSLTPRVWFEVLFTGFPIVSPAGPDPTADCTKTIQATIDALDLSMNGGGYAGSSADCAGNPAIGAGSLTNAAQPCTTNTNCRNAISGLAAACGLGEPSKCNNSIPGMCDVGFQDQCDAEWISGGFSHISAVDTSTTNYRFGSTVNDSNSICLNDFAPSYAGTLVVDVPASAKGTYTIDFKNDETFVHNGLTPPDDNIPLVAFNAGKIKIGCGSCCFGVGTPAPGCTDGLSAAECALLAQPAIFSPDATCLNPPTDDGCCACLTNADCDDGDACTTDVCNSCVCTNNARVDWTANECCDSATGNQTTLGCPAGSDCGAASCTEPGNHGVAQCLPTPGALCDDGVLCTYGDTCGATVDSCVGIDANTVVCVDSVDCGTVTGTAHPCVAGFCNCTDTPDLDIEIFDAGGPNCFDAGEKVLATVHVAGFASPINGGQFMIQYDPSCLDYLGTIQSAAYPKKVYNEVVDEAAGTIFVAVGIDFGDPDGPQGDADMVSFSFAKKGECNSCIICPISNNPYNTYLTDDAGQRVTIVPRCSKPIYDQSELVLTTPGSTKVNVDCDHPTATTSWDAPSASDSCGAATTVVCRGEHDSGLIYDGATVNGGGELLIGDSSFCCYATSAGPCGQTVGCPPDTNCADGDGNGKPDGCWTVTVSDETSLDITVGLEPLSQSAPGAVMTRCIKFSLYSNCAVEPLIFSDDVQFGGIYEYSGKSTGKIKIPGSGQFSCITAQDLLHTLRSCYTFGANDCAGGQLNARFSGDPILGGNWLIGGNLDGWKKDVEGSNPSLDTIDILDFGTFVSQYLVNYGTGNTPCGTTGLGHGGLAGANADINGDGVADTDDYAFISSNFLVNSKQCCCGPQTASAVGVTEISVAQLRADGRADLISADLNGDGMLNLADMAAFEQGVRPTTKTPAKGGSRTGSR